jgi:hypothetical protein
MSVVPSHQPLGVYMPIFSGESEEVSVYTLKPCMAAIKVQASERKKCDVRLSPRRTNLWMTPECYGYKTLYSLQNFGPIEGISSYDISGRNSDEGLNTLLTH